MRILGRLLAMALLATTLVVVAVVSIQNIELVSIQFLIWQSVQLPFGILLAFGVGLGLVLGSFISVGSDR